MQRILLVKTSSLGDVIHNLPVVNDILQHFPNAQIDWVVEESFSDIPRLHPAVKTIYPVAFRRWRKTMLSHKTWTEIGIFKDTIKSNQHDAVIDTQGLLKSALIAYCAKGVKHGYDKNSIREPLASRLYDKTYAISYQQHAVARNRALVAQSLGYPTPSSTPDYGINEKKDSSDSRMDIGLQSIYIMALHGTSRDSKLWPVSHWVALGKTLAEKDLQLVLPWANDAELLRANEIANNLGNAKVLPKLSIGDLARVIAQAKGAVGVDTGLSHLAVALSIPTVAIYTDTDPELTGVIAGAISEAVNLGRIGQTPNVEEVTSALMRLCLHSQPAKKR